MPNCTTRVRNFIITYIYSFIYTYSEFKKNDIDNNTIKCSGTFNQNVSFFREYNPNIHKEVPKVEEYKSRKNLRNLVQAYSTSSHRPSYERTNSKYGLYATCLSKYISKNIPVTKVFEEVGKCKT